MDWLYGYDSVHLFVTLQLSPPFKAKMHFGMARVVDSPKELCISLAPGVRSIYKNSDTLNAHHLAAQESQTEEILFALSK